MPQSSVTVHQTSSWIGNITRLVRINSDGICMLQRIEILFSLLLQAQRRHGATLGIMSLDRLPYQVLLLPVNHRREVASPGGIGVNEERQSVVVLHVLSNFHNPRKPIDGAFFGGTNNGNDCIDGDFLLSAMLQLLFKQVDVNMGIQIDFDLRDAFRAKSGNC